MSGPACYKRMSSELQGRFRNASTEADVCQLMQEFTRYVTLQSYEIMYLGTLTTHVGIYIDCVKEFVEFITQFRHTKIHF